MHDAGGRDDLVGRVTIKVEGLYGPADIERQRPGLQTRQDSAQFRAVQVYFDASQFGELGDLPEYDRRDAPGIIGEQCRFARRQIVGQRIEQNVGIKIQHPT